jgi:hypothetical protein
MSHRPINRRRKIMRKNIWVFVAMAGMAIISFTTVQGQDSAVHSLGAATAGVANTTPVPAVPIALANVPNNTAGNQSGMQKRSAVGVNLSTGRTVPCTYAYAQAYGFCPPKANPTCTYADFQTNGSCK